MLTTLLALTCTLGPQGEPGSLDAPTADSRVADAPAAPAPAAALAPTAPSAADLAAPRRPIDEVAFPRMPLGRLLLDTGKTMARPLVPETSDWWIITGMFAGAALAIAIDVPVHAGVQLIPDPVILGAEVSYWGSMLGEGWIDLGVVLAIGVFGGRRGMRVAYAGLQALAATAVISRVGKLLFRLERPSFDPERHHWWRSGDAMPSGHTMSAFATAAVLASEWPQLAPLFYGLAAYVGLARIQQSTHWLSDVVVGAALGTLFGLEASRLTRRWELEVQPWAGPGGVGLSFTKQF